MPSLNTFSSSSSSGSGSSSSDITNQPTTVPSSSDREFISKTIVMLQDLQLSSLANNITASTNGSGTTLSNISSNASSEFGAEAERYILMVNFVAEIAVMIVGIGGNAIVIAVILFFTKGNSVTDVYMLNLAIADMTFLAGLVFMIDTSINDHWVFGNFFCKMFMATTAMNQFASSLLLSLMSFDRYLAVCHPIFSQRYRHTASAKVICLVLWILCFVLMIPIFMYARTDEQNRTCGIFWPDGDANTRSVSLQNVKYSSGVQEHVFTLYSFCIGFLMPLALIVIFYRCVMIKLRSTASGPMAMHSERRARNRENANKKVSRLVKAIVITYGFCWLPYWIGQMLLGFTKFEGLYTLNQVAACLSYLNSAVNPILYAFLSDGFRRRCSRFWQSALSFELFKRLRRTQSASANQNQNNYNNSNINNSCNNRQNTRTNLATDIDVDPNSGPESRYTIQLGVMTSPLPSPLLNVDCSAAEISIEDDDDDDGADGDRDRHRDHDDNATTTTTITTNRDQINQTQGNKPTGGGYIFKRLNFNRKKRHCLVELHNLNSNGIIGRTVLLA